MVGGQKLQRTRLLRTPVKKWRKLGNTKEFLDDLEKNTAYPVGYYADHNLEGYVAYW